MELTKERSEIKKDPIKKEKGPCVILAGAGTGKTYTIVEKLKYLVESGIYKPERIVCITFSNEAANNLVLRIGKALKLDYNGKWPIVRTFHGFSADLLRTHGSKIGIQEKFKILDPDEAKVVLHRSLKINVGNCHKYIGTIGTVKDLGIKIEDLDMYLQDKLGKYNGINLEKRYEDLEFQLRTLYLKRGKEEKKNILSEILKVKELIELGKFLNAWKAYEKIKNIKNYQDYSDLNVNALKLILENPEIVNDYDYFIVDEFQDTNKLQLDFIVALVKKRNITIVGDLNQSIYRFRGAYRGNFQVFKNSFNVNESEVFNLDKSFRSPNSVLRIAHKLILNNYKNKDDCFFVKNTHNREGDKIEVYELKNGKEEARKVVDLINAEIKRGVEPEEICVMFRTHQQGRIIRKALDFEGIEYCSVSKTSLLKQKSIKTVVDYLTILDKLKRKEPGGEQQWWDLAYQLDFFNEDLIKIGKFIKDCKKELEEEKKLNPIEKQIIGFKILNGLGNLGLSQQGKMASKILLDKINLLLSLEDKSCSEIIKETYNVSGLINEQKTKQEKEIMLNLNKFYEIAKMHEDLYDSDLQNFLYYLEVLETLGIEIEASELEEQGVRLMTSHATKGLEYKTVIITNMAQKRFPIERYGSNGLIPGVLLPEIREQVQGLNEEEQEEFIKAYEKENQLMEERRLAYVSFTRTKEKLILTYAKDYGNRKNYPSQFLNEINYKNNEDVKFEVDNSETYVEQGLEIKPALEFEKVLNSGNFDESLNSMLNLVKRSELKDSMEIRSFSPSALLLFEECQKKFEYKYVYNMPEKKTISWEDMRLGSFVHLVLENGVNKRFKTLGDFESLAKEMHLDEDWESIELEQALFLIKVFYERNKEKYNDKSRTEQYLNLELDGMKFIGFADRIDFSNDGIEIIDYKTGKSYVDPKHRNWQLGFYALAARQKYENIGKVRKVTLDMLKQEKPLEFEIDDNGNAFSTTSERMHGFNINEVEQELIKAAQTIQLAYKQGFKPCSIEKNCEFCNEYVYNL